MRTLMLAVEYPPLADGPAWHALELSRGLVEEGHEPWVVTFWPPQHQREIAVTVECGVKVCRVPLYPVGDRDRVVGFLHRNLRCTEGALAVASRAGGFDLVVSHGHAAGPAAVAVKRALNIALVLHVHRLHWPPASGGPEAHYFRATEAWVVQEAAAVICASDSLRRTLCEALNLRPGALLVLPEAIRVSDYDSVPPQSRPPGARHIVFAGGLSPGGGLETLLPALRLVLDRVPGARLLVAGTAPDEARPQRLNALARRWGVSRAVVLLGHVGGRELVALFKSADAVAVSGGPQATGRTAVEAMAARAPVVVSDAGELGALVSDGLTGRKVPPRDPQALAAALVDTLLDPEGAAAMAGQAYEMVRARYDWRPVLSRTLEVYSAAIQASRANA